MNTHLDTMLLQHLCITNYYDSVFTCCGLSDSKVLIWVFSSFVGNGLSTYIYNNIYTYKHS